MRISVISTIHAPWGGSEELWYKLAETSLQQGHYVEVSMIYTGILSNKVENLIKKGLILHKRRGYIAIGTPRNKRIIKKLLNLIANKFSNPYKNIFHNNPDIIVHNGSLYQAAEDPFFNALLSRYGTPYIIINQIVAEFGRAVKPGKTGEVRAIYEQAKQVFFVSERNMATAKRQLVSEFKNAAIITNPINLSVTDLVPFPRIENERVHFAMVGNLLVDHKGQDLLLEVLGGENWKSRNWQLDIYGEGPDASYLTDLCKLYGISDKVQFKGFTSDIRKIWQMSHILLMPSLMEGLPLAVMEAMLCGRPVMATDVGGHRELINEGKEGYIAASPGTHAIHLAMEKAWSNRDKWEQMGEFARERALAYYVPDTGSKLLDNIINDFLSFDKQ